MRPGYPFDMCSRSLEIWNTCGGHRLVYWRRDPAEWIWNIQAAEATWVHVPVRIDQDDEESPDKEHEDEKSKDDIAEDNMQDEGQNEDETTEKNGQRDGGHGRGRHPARAGEQAADWGHRQQAEGEG